MKVFFSSVKKFRILWIFVLSIAGLTILADYSRKNREYIEYPKALDLVVATVEGEEITLRDFALYVAYQEDETQKQAEIYDSEYPLKYWNIHTNGVYIRNVVREEAMSMAIHDTLFYHLSKSLDLELTDEETDALENDVEDFWYDLTDEDKEKKLGITKEDIFLAMEKIAYAQKAQLIYAGMNAVEYSDYEHYEEPFLDFLSDYDYKVEDNVLNRLHFGEITLEHE